MSKRNKSNRYNKKQERVTGSGEASKTKPPGFSYYLFYLKDLLLAFVLGVGIYIFINGSFYTKDDVAVYNKNLRAYLSSTEYTEAQKEEQRAAKIKNINAIKVKWGYFFAYNNLLKENIKTISNNPELDYQSKIFAKAGELGYILNLIKENTPDTAVVLMPIDSSMFADPQYRFEFNAKQNEFKGIYKHKKYFNWFVYPRQIVWLTAADRPRLKDATHVMIFDKKGAEYAQRTEGEQLVNYQIYPVNKTALHVEGN